MGSSIALLSTLLSLGAAWLYLSPSRRQEQSTFGFVVTATVGLHTLLVLSNLALHRPPNLFTRLGIPINSPADRIRSLLMREVGFNMMGERGAVIVPREIPRGVETLLTRLGVHGSRDTYVRCVCLFLDRCRSRKAGSGNTPCKRVCIVPRPPTMQFSFCRASFSTTCELLHYSFC